MIKRSLWALSFLIFLSVNVFALDEKECFCPSGKCSISFPENFQHIKQKMPSKDETESMQYDLYIAQIKDQAILFLIVAQYPNVIIEDEISALEGFINGMLSNKKNNELISADLCKFNGHMAADFLVKGETRYFKGKACVNNSTLYLIATEYDINFDFEKEFDDFVRSFNFVD